MLSLNGQRPVSCIPLTMIRYIFPWKYQGGFVWAQQHAAREFYQNFHESLQHSSTHTRTCLGRGGGGGGSVFVIVKKYTVVCWIRCEFCISSILQSKQGQKQVLCQAVTVSMCVQLWQDFWNACTSMPVSCLTLKKIFKFTVRGWGLKTLQGFYGSLGS